MLHDRVQDNHEARVNRALAEAAVTVFGGDWWTIHAECMGYPAVIVEVDTDYIITACREGRDIVTPTVDALNAVGAREPWAGTDWQFAMVHPIRRTDGVHTGKQRLIFAPGREVDRYRVGGSHHVC